MLPNDVQPESSLESGMTAPSADMNSGVELTVIDHTPLQPRADVSVSCSIAAEDETLGCQPPAGEAGLITQPGPGLTLEMLSKGLNLPISFLQEQGLSDRKRNGLPAVRIPYLDENRDALTVRFQLGLQEGRGVFEQRKTDKPALYGLWNLDEIRKGGNVLLVDGLFDFWACRHRGIAVLGFPENRIWHDDWNKHLSGLTAVIWEKDAPVLVAKLIPTVQDLRIIKLPEGIQSPSEAHVSGMDLLEILQESTSRALSAEDFLQNRAKTLIGQLEKNAAPVLKAADPVEVVRQEIRRLGYGGDLDIPLITYLAVTSRLLAMRPGAMPVHLLLVGQPSSGKSYGLQIVLKLIPADSYNKIDAGSPSVFIYDDFDYQHRAAIFSESDSLPAGEDNAAASAIRNMLQDHHLHYKVTEREPDTGQFVVRDIDRPGPTVLITTAVRRLGAQLDSRLFSLEVPDGLDQIQAALSAQADLELEGVPEPDPALIAYQSYLQELAPWDVSVPFAKKLAIEIGRLPNASRVLRDQARLLSMIKTVALLRHQKRGRNDKGRLIAEIDDYALVYELVGKMYETSVTRVSDKIRDVLSAVAELKHEKVSPVSETKGGEAPGLFEAGNYTIGEDGSKTRVVG